MATATDGSVWVANNGGSPFYSIQHREQIDPITGNLDTFSMNTKQDAGPWGINLDGENNVYVANFEELSISVLKGSKVDSRDGQKQERHSTQGRIQL